jgi:small-conductance mechanosensitive channel
MTVLSNSLNPKRVCNRRLIPVILLALVFLVCPLVSPIRAADSGNADDVLHFLDQTIDWYRRIASTDTAAGSPEEVIYRDGVRQEATKALQFAFEYARSQAAILSAGESGSSTTRAAAGSRGANLAQAIITAQQQMVQIQAQLDAIAGDLPAAAPTTRPILEARRGKLLAELDLQQSRMSALKDLVGFISSSQSAGGGLLEKVNDLQRTVPEATVAPKTTASGNTTADKSPNPPQSSSPSLIPDLLPSTPPSAPTASSTEAFHAANSGLLGLVEEMFTLTREMSTLSGLENQTDKLSAENQKLRDAIRPQLQEAMQRANALAATRESEDVATLSSQRDQIEGLAARFKLLAAAAVPLADQNIMLDTARTNLTNWRTTVQREYGQTLRYLLFRVISIVVAILILVGISEIWRRATFRYVKDLRRRRQFLLLRRIVVGFFIVVIIIAGVVTEIGSLATFAGLITAGIAVSLQTVIVSGVAYFFLIGRYGVRVGDRVTISGITGDVVDIGLFRLYMMELGGTPPNLYRTGRIVVFSNSVLFGGSAFFKQMPGADYTWHQVVMTLAPDSDMQLAEKLLLQAVAGVYEPYRENIERQHVSVNESMHLQLPPPKPEGHLRFMNGGLEFTIRYPVELHRAPEVDDAITRKLLEAIEKEPKLKLVPSGSPSIQAAA